MFLYITKFSHNYWFKRREINKWKHLENTGWMSLEMSIMHTQCGAAPHSIWSEETAEVCSSWAGQLCRAHCKSLPTKPQAVWYIHSFLVQTQGTNQHKFLSYSTPITINWTGNKSEINKKDKKKWKGDKLTGSQIKKNKANSSQEQSIHF